MTIKYQIPKHTRYEITFIYSIASKLSLILLQRTYTYPTVLPYLSEFMIIFFENMNEWKSVGEKEKMNEWTFFCWMVQPT